MPASKRGTGKAKRGRGGRGGATARSGGRAHSSRDAQDALCKPEPPDVAVELEPHNDSSDGLRLKLVAQRRGCRVNGAHRIVESVPELREALERQVVRSRCERDRVSPRFKVEPTWTFDMDEYEQVFELLSTHLESQGCVVSPLPARVLVELRRPLRELVDDEELRRLVGAEQWDSMYDFQKDGVRRAYEFNGCILFGDEMGLGKTRQGAAVATMCRDSWPVLVLCPAILQANWCTTFEELSEPVKNGSERVKIVWKGKDDFSDAGVVIMSYDKLRQPELFTRLMARRFGVVILDESQMIKNSTAGRTKLALKVCQAARHRILLSGTPMQKTTELFTQIRAIDSTIFPVFFPYRVRDAFAEGKFYFASRYCDPKMTRIKGSRFVPTFDGCSRQWELNALLVRRVMVRRLKSVVLGDKLPPKIRERIVIGQLEGRRLADFQSQLSEAGELRETNGTIEANPAFMRLMQLTVQMKVKYVCDAFRETVVPFLKDNPDEKLLFFAHHGCLKDGVQKEIDNAGLKMIRIDGDVLPLKRQPLVDCFQSDPETRVAILGIKAAGAGITLTAAARVVIGELPFGFQDAFQAEDRAHRIGQKSTVQVEYWVMKGTTDERLWTMLDRKLRNANQVIDNVHASIQASTRVHEIARPMTTASAETMDEQSAEKTEETVASETMSNAPEIEHETVSGELAQVCAVQAPSSIDESISSVIQKYTSREQECERGAAVRRDFERKPRVEKQEGLLTDMEAGARVEAGVGAARAPLFPRIVQKQKCFPIFDMSRAPPPPLERGPDAKRPKHV